MSEICIVSYKNVVNQVVMGVVNRLYKCVFSKVDSV